jgi:hypothetical protein
MDMDGCFLNKSGEHGGMPHHPDNEPAPHPLDDLTEALLDGLKSLYVRVSIGASCR